MSKSKVFVASIQSNTNEHGERETIVQLKIVDTGKELIEHHETPSEFIRLLQVLVDYFNTSRNDSRNLIEMEEFWDWLKKEKYI